MDEVPAGLQVLSDRSKPWGTGHAVLSSAPAIDGPFAVVNADDFYGAESYVALATFLSSGGSRLATIGFRAGDTVVERRPVSRALLEIGDDGLLRWIVEIAEMWRQDDHILYRDAEGRRRQLDGWQPVSMNIWGFVPDVLDELRRYFVDFLSSRGATGDAEFLLPDVIQSMIRDRRAEVEVLSARGEWCGITHGGDQVRARSVIASLVRRGCYPVELWT